MNFKDKDLIIFDFDGTLINSIPDLTLAINKMLTQYNAAPLTIEEVTPFIGNGAKPLVRRAIELAMPERDLTEAFLKEAFDIYFSAYKEETCKDTFLYPGVLETLQKLKSKGYTLAICTNKPFDFIAPILEALEIKDYFEAWIGEDSLSKKKPDAAPLLHLVERMQTTVAKSVMVGDSKNDILAAQNAKMDSIGVSYGYNYNENIADYKPTVVADLFSELQDLF
ncbi:phosphoglycolate phosphatase [Formosa algae]|uniref:phosphoglycolate phosphatase n=1 Tax=Formosa algae TaxID=225843 RepID=UPI000CCFBF58|nr:phosphoglycolate phosphatase [Formosa algae]PNW29053.1 phosphoglycolate phosphatase [Formosa algae]